MELASLDDIPTSAVVVDTTSSVVASLNSRWLGSKAARYSSASTPHRLRVSLTDQQDTGVPVCRIYAIGEVDSSAQRANGYTPQPVSRIWAGALPPFSFLMGSDKPFEPLGRLPHRLVVDYRLQDWFGSELRFHEVLEADRRYASTGPPLDDADVTLTGTFKHWLRVMSSPDADLASLLQDGVLVSAALPAMLTIPLVTERIAQVSIAPSVASVLLATSELCGQEWVIVDQSAAVDRVVETGERFRQDGFRGSVVVQIVRVGARDRDYDDIVAWPANEPSLRVKVRTTAGLVSPGDLTRRGIAASVASADRTPSRVWSEVNSTADGFAS